MLTDKLLGYEPGIKGSNPFENTKKERIYSSPFCICIFYKAIHSIKDLCQLLNFSHLYRWEILLIRAAEQCSVLRLSTRFVTLVMLKHTVYVTKSYDSFAYE